MKLIIHTSYMKKCRRQVSILMLSIQHLSFEKQIHLQVNERETQHGSTFPKSQKRKKRKTERLGFKKNHGGFWYLE